MVQCPAGKLAGLFMRGRDWLWLAVVLALGCGWFYHSSGLWIGKALAEEEMRRLNEEIARLRSESKSD
jgi:hypothetical protein